MDKRTHPVSLQREDGSHRCWISETDRDKLLAGGHVMAVSENKVRLLSSEEKAERKRAVERALDAVGVQVARRQRGIGKVF